MIEIIYDDETNDNHCTTGNLKLPKNIRQIGEPGEKRKIYVEDYVITYINQLAKGSPGDEKIAIMLGRFGVKDGMRVTFISGAMEVEQARIHEDCIVFTNEIWTEIYERIKQYFKDVEIVGWFLTRPGQSLGISQKITKIHVDNFAGQDKSLFIMDPVDHEEAFFIYENGQLARQNGYYIYYERNEDMQNYMIATKKSASAPKVVFQTDAVKTRKSIIPKPVKADVKKSSETKKTSDIKKAFKKNLSKLNMGTPRWAYGLSTLLLMVVMIFGVTILNNFEKMEDMEQTIQNITSRSQTEESKLQVVEAKETKAVETQAEQTQATETQAQQAANETAESDELLDITSAVMSSDIINETNEYIVKEGDTLVSISKKIYNDIDHIDKISKLNNIQDTNRIYPGMRLILP